MAKVEYREGQEPLHGIYCNAMFKTYANSGLPTMFVLPIPSKEDAEKNPALREERIVKLCVGDIQMQMHDIREAIQQYRAIKKRVRRSYQSLHHLYDDEDELKTAILTAYNQSRRVLPSRKVDAQRIDFPENGHLSRGQGVPKS